MLWSYVENHHLSGKQKYFVKKVSLSAGIQEKKKDDCFHVIVHKM